MVFFFMPLQPVVTDKVSKYVKNFSDSEIARYILQQLN